MILASLRDRFASLLETIQGLDPVWAPVVFVGFYIAATILFLPGSILTLGAGFLFGPVWGSLLVVVGANIGAGLAFLLGRGVARDSIARKLQSNSRFAAIDDAIGREGARMVLLLRLSPIFPFNLLNYGLGLTKIGFRDYALASAIGMLPGTVLYVYLGSLFKSVADIAAGSAREKTMAEWAVYGIGLVATVVVTVYVARVARKALAKASIEE